METKMFDPFLCKIFYATKCWRGDLACSRRLHQVQGTANCRGLEVGARLGCLRNSKMTRVARTKQAEVAGGGGEVRGARR